MRITTIVWVALWVALCFLLACTSPEVDRRFGAQCDNNSDCDDRCVSGQDFPEGLCTESCDSDRECRGAARCVDKESGICLFSCTDDRGCEFLGGEWECSSEDLREDPQEEAEVCVGK